MLGKGECRHDTKVQAKDSFLCSGGVQREGFVEYLHPCLTSETFFSPFFSSRLSCFRKSMSSCVFSMM